VSFGKALILFLELFLYPGVQSEKQKQKERTRALVRL
jgi:hypothetical protein